MALRVFGEEGISLQCEEFTKKHADFLPPRNLLDNVCVCFLFGGALDDTKGNPVSPTDFIVECTVECFSCRLQGDDALAELLNSVQNDPSLISAGAAERDEDLSTLTQGLFDE